VRVRELYKEKEQALEEALETASVLEKENL